MFCKFQLHSMQILLLFFFKMSKKKKGKKVETTPSPSEFEKIVMEVDLDDITLYKITICVYMNSYHVWFMTLQCWLLKNLEAPWSDRKYQSCRILTRRQAVKLNFDNGIKQQCFFFFFFFFFFCYCCYLLLRCYCLFCFVLSFCSFIDLL